MLFQAQSLIDYLGRIKAKTAMAFGWLPLVIFVSVCVAVDKVGVVAIGYESAKGCWINNSWANLYFFAVPVAVSLLWNAVFFMLL